MCHGRRKGGLKRAQTHEQQSMVISSPLSDFLALWSSHCHVQNRPNGADSADPYYNFWLFSVARGSSQISGQSAPMKRNLACYLRDHPSYEVYTDQKTRPSTPSDLAAAALTALEIRKFAKPARPALPRSWVAFSSLPPIFERHFLRVQPISADSNCGAPLRLPLPPAARIFNTPHSAIRRPCPWA